VQLLNEQGAVRDSEGRVEGERGDTPLNRVLLVAPASKMVQELSAALRDLGVREVAWAVTATNVRSNLAEGVDVLFLSLDLPDRLAHGLLLEALELCPVPQLVLISDGYHPDLFTLAQAGADKHLVWPADLDTIRACLVAPDRWSLLARCARLFLGCAGMRDAQEEFRSQMLQRALAVANGSRRGAARILGVSRPAVQRMIREGGGKSP